MKFAPPIVHKKAKSSSCTLVIEEDGGTEVMGNPDTIRALGQYVDMKDPTIIFASESCLGRNKVDNIKMRLGIVGSLVVDMSDSCVGLFFLWNDSVRVKLLSFSDSHIDVEVEDGRAPLDLPVCMMPQIEEGRMKTRRCWINIRAYQTCHGS
ncbi:hypothetical protein V6N13_111416 [Hibiscus sabdariffa]